MRTMGSQTKEETVSTKSLFLLLFAFRSLPHRTLVGFVSLAFCFSLSSAFATTMIPLSKDQLTQSATAIVQGQVTTIESFQEPQTGKFFTHITLAIEEVLKGPINGRELTLKQPGGMVGGCSVNATPARG